MTSDVAREAYETDPPVRYRSRESIRRKSFRTRRWKQSRRRGAAAACFDGIHRRRRRAVSI